MCLSLIVSSFGTLDLACRQDAVAEVTAELRRGAEVDLSAEHAGQLKFRSGHAQETEYPASFRLYEHVDVTLGPELVSQHRTEQCQSANGVLPAVPLQRPMDSASGDLTQPIASWALRTCGTDSLFRWPCLAAYPTAGGVVFPQRRAAYPDDLCAGRPCDPHVPTGDPGERPTAGVGLGQQGPDGPGREPGRVLLFHPDADRKAVGAGVGASLVGSVHEAAGRTGGG